MKNKMRNVLKLKKKIMCKRILMSPAKSKKKKKKQKYKLMNNKTIFKIKKKMKIINKMK